MHDPEIANDLPVNRKSETRESGYTEDRHVAAARNVDADVAHPAVSQVVAFQRAAETAGLDAHDRVELRVELRIAPEDLDRDRIGLDPVGSPRECLLDDISEEAPVAVAPAAAAPVAVAAVPVSASPNEDDRTGAQMVAEGFTWVDPSGRSLTLSGQVNPAFNVVDDGISTDVFIVDNDTSGTRFRLDADAPLGGTLLGATLEIGASPNNSSDVNQLNAADGCRLQRPPRRSDLPQRPLRPAAARQGIERRGRHRRIRPLARRRPDHVCRRRRHRRRHHLHRRHRLQRRRHRRRRLLRLRRRSAGAHPLRQPDVRAASRARPPTARTTSGRRR